MLQFSSSVRHISSYYLRQIPSYRNYLHSTPHYSRYEQLPSTQVPPSEKATPSTSNEEIRATALANCNRLFNSRDQSQAFHRKETVVGTQTFSKAALPFTTVRYHRTLERGQRRQTTLTFSTTANACSQTRQSLPITAQKLTH